MAAMVTPEELRRLHDKYERMLVLRDAHDRARNDPAFAEPDPKVAMAALAAEFPGVLREIDRLERTEIALRLELIGEAERGARPPARWMEAQAAFHAAARGALTAKRWISERARSDRESVVAPATRAAFAEALPTLAFPEDAARFIDDLAAIHRPPRGRLMDIVFACVATERGLSPAETQALVFGTSVARAREVPPATDG